MSHIIRPISYAGWSHCIHLTNTVFEAVISTDVGPRILRYGRVGGPNLLWLDEFAAGQAEETKTWRAYGGHSFDATVDAQPFLPPENVPVGYDLTEDGINFHSVDFGGISKTLSLRMCRRGGLEIKHTLTNTGDTPRRCAVNGNTLLRTGGMAALPLPAGEKPVFGGDRPELCRGKALSLVRPNPVAGGEFQIGCAAKDRWCGWFTQGSLFVLTVPPVEDAPADEVSIRFGSNPRRVELSSFSPERSLAPGESLLHTEVWNIFAQLPFPRDDEQAEQLLRTNRFYYDFTKKPVKGIDF